MNLRIPRFSRVLATFADTAGQWTLYSILVKEGATFLWLKLRLQLPATTPARHGHARVYELAWNPLELRFARSKHSLGLERDHPILSHEVELFMSLNHDRTWLTDADGAGVDASEIEPELARLKWQREKGRNQLRELRREGFARHRAEQKRLAGED